jgi:F0F1-type ATP synthase assembly protein I
MTRVTAPDPGRGEITTAANPWSFVGMGVEIAVPVVLFTFLGYKADGWLGTEPWLVVVGALLGIAVSFYTLFKRVLGSGQGSDREDR